MMKLREGSKPEGGAQATELLEAIWSIMVSFVDLGFGVHAVQQVVGSSASALATLALDSSEGVESSKVTSTTKMAPARAEERAEAWSDS